MRIHAMQTGRICANGTFLRGEGWGSLMRRRRDVEFPAHAFVIEHPEGLIAIDTGPDARVRTPRPIQRFVPVPHLDERDELGPRMRALGLDPHEVHRAVVTHLDWDHAGGVRHLPNAEILVHRPELEFAATRMGRFRYQTQLWPDGFAPAAYDLDDEPYGPFPASRRITEAGDVRVVPLPGHSVAQVGVVVEQDDERLFFTADHMLRVDWFEEDYAAGRHLCLGVFFARQAVETSHRIRRFADEAPTTLIPSHDGDAVARLADRQTRATAASG